MPLQATSGAASYDAFGGGVPVAANYIEDVFSTWLYTGNGSTQTITNGIDLAGKGGLVWVACRSNAQGNYMTDTVRGATKQIAPFAAAAQTTESTGLTAFSSTGFTVGSKADWNFSNFTYASWTFREQPKFFDCVTYTGNGSTQNIAHNLGSEPGCIIVKSTSSATNWAVYHRGLSSPSIQHIQLNTTSAALTSATVWNSTAPTSTQFSVGNFANTNASGETYVAYLFAHNAGGFGLTGTDNVISCGSFTATSGGAATVTLGYEPQWLLFKSSSNALNWSIIDNMRAWSYSAVAELKPNTSGAEDPNAFIANPTATGFEFQSGTLTANATYIYIAIRRGPMRTPTTGTSVFVPTAATANSVITTNFPVDLLLDSQISSSNKFAFSRLMGGPLLQLNLADAEVSGDRWFFASNTTTQDLTRGAVPGVFWSFRRAPGFFDVVCWTGNGTTQAVSHNLGVAPELIIVKRRNTSGSWVSYNSASGAGKYLVLNSTNADTSDTAPWNNTAPTASVFTVGTGGGAFTATNASGSTYVAYLFASCPGVSKVGSYTGNGSSQTINMGFTGGARFFLVKRTDSTGDWWVYDSARGIVSAADPALRLNSTAAEVTSADAVDTDSTGLIVNQESTCNINVSSATYIYLGIS